MNEFALLLRKDILVILNSIKLILRNPMRLLPYSVVVGYFGIFYFLRKGKRQEVDTESLSKIQEAADHIDEGNFFLPLFVGGLTLLALIFVLFRLYRATRKNVTFFSMADVNLLFPSPVKPSMLLMYYMIRSLFPAIGGSLIFILYSTAQLNDVFDFNFWNLSVTALGLALFIFILSPIRFLIYTLHTKYDILNEVKTGIYVTGILLSLMIIVPGLLADTFWKGMFDWITSPWFDLFPLVGWSRGILTYVTHGSGWKVVGLLACYAGSYVLIVALVLQHAGMYYEDVLEATQSGEDLREKVKRKRTASESTISLNTKKKIDFKDFGKGAVAIYWRNYVHASRQDFHPLFGLFSGGLAALSVVFAICSHFEWFSHRLIYGYFFLLMLIYFLAGIGRVSVGDLKKPFIILIPASWASKFWNLIKLDIYQTLIFTLMLIVPSVWIAGLNPWLAVLFPLSMVFSYLTGFSINLVTQVGFDEGLDRKLVRPLIIGGVIFFGILPSLGLAFFTTVLSRQMVYGFAALNIGMGLVAAVMLHVAMDVISRLEFKEM